MIILLADHGIKRKESEKKDKYENLPGNLKNDGTWRWRLYQSWLVPSVNADVKNSNE